MAMHVPQDFDAITIGDSRRTEFRTVLTVLSASAPLQSFATIEEATADRHDVGAPDIVVLLQSRPHEFTQAAVERLRGRWPLAGLITVLGSWCEAETRSGRPLAGTWRVTWHQWSPRFELELARWRAGRCPAWGLPATTLEEERIQRGYEPPAGRNVCPTVIAIRTDNRELAGMLADVCQSMGQASIWCREDRLPDGCEIAAILYDVVLPASPAEMASRFELWRSRPILALADYPRAEDVAAALAAGAVGLVSKPLVVEELIWQLRRAVDEPVVSPA